MGGAWLCQHLWEHYAFSGDRSFLSQRGYAIMKKAAQFLLDFLVQDKQGHLTTCPSTSPENLFITASGEQSGVSAGSTMDIAIIHDLFTHCIAASQVLDIDQGFAYELAQALARLPQPAIGRYGQLQEWSEDFAEHEPGHRHVAHLYGLHPGEQITMTRLDRKSTRLNSSHQIISYAVFCLKKKKKLSELILDQIILSAH